MEYLIFCPGLQKGAMMGKSLNGKQLGTGISQRTDGLYQARFTNRFGLRKTFYAKTLNEVRKKLIKEQYEDEKALNVISKEMTLDEWYEVWINTCKKNCRNSTKESYTTHYNRVKKDLGWRKINSLNLIIMQDAINKLDSDNARKNSKKILEDMLNKAMDSDLILKNVARQINTVITKEEKKERRVLTPVEVDLFLEKAKGTFYYNLFVLALETGMRVGELCALTWSDVNLSQKMIHVTHTLCYFSKNGKYVFELHDAKTKNGKRLIPLTAKAVTALMDQKKQNQKITKEKVAMPGYENLVFITKNNRPTQQFIITECMSLIIKNIQNEESVNFERFTLHTLRHTFATQCIESGMRPKTLQKLLGHGTLQMTMDWYCHVTDDTLFEEMQKYEMACM